MRKRFSPAVLFTLAWASTSSAADFYSNDFDGTEVFGAGVTGGISGPGSVQSVQGYAALAPAFGGSFLRSIAQGNPAPASKLTLNGLPPNAPVVVSFSLAIIDSWDGSAFPPNPSQAPDRLDVAINGSSAFSETFTNLSAFGATQTYAGPYLAHEAPLAYEAGSSRLDSAVALNFSATADGSGSLVVDVFTSGAGWLGAAGTSGPEEESWAIDNIRVSSPEVPALGAPGATTLALALLATAGFATRRIAPTSRRSP
jgi:hypothetical protein